MLSDYDKNHIQGILYGEGDWFNAHLLRLIAKADTANKERLRLAFPEEVKAFEDWQKPCQHPNKVQFKSRYGYGYCCPDCSWLGGPWTNEPEKEFEEGD